MGRPGNFDVVRPHDSSSVFDSGMPKDVSPYQPRVAVSVEIQPKSVFKPRRLQRQPKQINGAKWGQTALKNIFGGEENVITNYMAQRLLGIVENTDSRISESMQQDDPLMVYRQPFNSGTDVTSEARPSVQSDESMGPISPASAGIADLFSPLRISIPEPSSEVTPTLADEMEAVAEVETQPGQAATQGGLMDIVQETTVGPARISGRPRYLGAGYGNTNRTGTYGLRDDDSIFNDFLSTRNGRAFSEQYSLLMERSMQSGYFDSDEYRYLARQLGQNLLRSIEFYTQDTEVQQMLFDKVNAKFPLDVNNIPYEPLIARAA